MRAAKVLEFSAKLCGDFRRETLPQLRESCESSLKDSSKTHAEILNGCRALKESLAVDLHIAFENEELVIPRDRKLTQQIHSIKKKATDAGYSRYDTEKNETSHHGDKLWALALAVHAAGGQKRKRKRRAIDASIV